jgi:Flp pilus assembly pilin Flp
MRTFEYALITILIVGAVLYGAVQLSRALSASFNNSAALIQNGGR